MDFTVKIDRNKSTSDAKQTLGKMVVFEELKSVFECFTLELPWLNNAQRISCFPPGEYDCIKVPATAAIPYEHILILNVPNREGCCIHKANYYLQLRGCVAVGDGYVDLNKDGEMDVKNSGKTFDAFMAIVPNKFKLIVS